MSESEPRRQPPGGDSGIGRAAAIGQGTFDVNITAMFRAARPHLGAGALIIKTSSINDDQPRPTLLPYATTR